MARYFNTAGVCDPRRHYMIPAAPRLPGARALIDRGEYFVVHAPRQTGKTTTLRAIVAELNEEGRYAALYMSCEGARPFPDDVDAAHNEVIGALLRSARSLDEGLRPPEDGPRPGGQRRLGDLLWAWADHCPRPIVLILDEIDAVQGRALLSILSDVRAVHPERPQHAPWAVVLCGMRDVRDYKAAAGGDATRLGTASPFNIKADSFRLGDFSADEVRQLYAQHTEATAQHWSAAALERAWDLSQGQPWLTNALAAEVVGKMDVQGTIEEEHIDRARERLIAARATHLDSLVARLGEERVRRVVAPILSGDELPDVQYDDDLSYLRDLGLIAVDGPVRFSNPIYREIVLRLLAARPEASAAEDRRRYVRSDGSLDVDAMMEGFASFWIQHGQGLARGMAWQEIASQLVLMGYLHAILNGTGLIDREVGVGRGRIDLLLRWPLPGRQWQRAAMELKVWRAGRPFPLQEGLTQLDAYLRGLGLDTGFLVIFDQRGSGAERGADVGRDQYRSPEKRSVRVLIL